MTAARSADPKSTDTNTKDLAIVSHDLRNSLTSIAMGSEVLQLSLKAPEIDREAASELLSITSPSEVPV